MASMKSATSQPSAWRSSTWLVVFTAALGLFTGDIVATVFGGFSADKEIENFLYSFIVPIMSYMFEVRLGQDLKYTQRYTSAMLFVLGGISVFCAPIVGHLADKSANRKIPLLIALIGCVIGTVLVAGTWSVWSVFVGRLLEGISGTGAWIVSFAMLTDSIDKKHYGKTLGFVSSFIATGVLTGPAVSGTLLQLFGYWPAWSAPFTLLAICLVARLVMIEKKKPGSAKEEAINTPYDESMSNEHTGLLSAESNRSERESSGETRVQVQKNFYRVMLSNASCIGACFNVLVFALIIAAFDATLPLHLRRTFNWGPAPTGFIFLAIQIPAVIMAPLTGWLRDRFGVRWPTAVGWLLQTPLIWFIGVPGTWDMPGLRTRSKQEVAFVAGTISLGLVAPLVRGSGTFQNTITLREIQDENPGIFGPNGGSSRLFAMTEVIFNSGLMVGPVLGGALVDTLGFYWMMFGLDKKMSQAEEPDEA